MANFLDKIKVNTAIKDHVKLDLSSDHITTANFMQYDVAFNKEMVPKEKISINMETFARLSPMPVPTFGRARINNRAFFVPYRTIFPAWNDFITDVQHISSVGTGVQSISKVPHFNTTTLMKFMINNGEDYQILQFFSDGDFNPQTERMDYLTDNGDGIKLLSNGRAFVKLLTSLGYQIFPSTNAGIEVSALPLLAAAKVYYDWFYPSAYADDALSTQLQALFNYDDYANRDSYELTEADIETIFLALAAIHVSYDSDYFVSAWQNPMSPNNGSYSDVVVPDISLDNSQAALSNDAMNNGTPQLTNDGSITQFGLNALRSLTDYLKRHQLVGARTLDRYLARFGVQLSAEKLKRSVYIGTKTQDIQFGDVMSTADTETSQLGDYAGKGIAYGQGNFDFETDEYGMLIIVSTIQPKAGYYQGIDRNCQHLSKLDFWTPEFDNLGSQAIAQTELFVPRNLATFGGTGNYIDGAVFGFTPRYAEYKVGKDKVTGDYRYHSMNVGQNSWHTMREFDFTTNNQMVISKEFVLGRDAAQYDRIFYNTDSNADKFRIIHHFDVASYSPMKALFDTYEFEEKGKEVTLNANGVKMN